MYLCTYVCNCDGWLCLSIFYHLCTYLSSRHLSSTINLHSYFTVCLGAQFPAVTCYTRLPCLPALAERVRPVCPASQRYLWLPGPSPSEQKKELITVGKRSNVQGIRRLPGMVASLWWRADRQLLISVSSQLHFTINIPEPLRRADRPRPPTSQGKINSRTGVCVSRSTPQPSPEGGSSKGI